MAAKKVVNAIDKHVGGRVRVRRTECGLSQNNLARKIEVTFQQVQKYQDGRNRMSASRLSQIAEALKVPPAFFFSELVDNAAHPKSNRRESSLA